MSYGSSNLGSASIPNTERPEKVFSGIRDLGLRLKRPDQHCFPSLRDEGDTKNGRLCQHFIISMTEASTLVLGGMLRTGTT